MPMSIAKLYYFKHLMIIQKYKCLILFEIHVNLELNLLNYDTREWEWFSPASEARKQVAENSCFEMRENVFKQPMEKLDLKRHKYKAKEKKVFEKSSKGILTNFKGLRIHDKVLEC